MLSPIQRQLRRAQMRFASSLATTEALRTGAATYASGREQHRILKLARRMEACAYSFQARVSRDENGISFVRRLNQRSCRSRLCMQCAAVKAGEDRKKVSELLNRAIELAPTSRALFLTLTARNRPIEQLKEMFDDHDRALRRFWRNPRVQRSTLGSFTALEVDIRGSFDRPEAGVHSHSAVFIDVGALSDDRYLTQRKWAALWRQALHVSYQPIVDVRVIRDRTGAGDTTAARAILPEVAKYVVDPSSLIDHGDGTHSANPKVVIELARALHRRRIHRFERLVAEAAKRRRSPTRKRTEPDQNP